MRIKNRTTMSTILAAAIILLLLPGLACTPSIAEPDEVDVIEEPIVIEEPAPIEEPAFRPEQALRFDFEDTVHSVAYSPSGDLLATGIFTLVDIWDASDGSRFGSVDGLPHNVMDLAFTLDDQGFYAAFALGGVNAYTLADGELVIDFHGDFDNYLALSPDSSRIATGNRSGMTWLWDASSGALIHEMDPADHVEGYSEWVSSLAFSPDGGMIAAGHWNGAIFLWEASSGSLSRMIEPGSDFDNAWGVAFSPDGRYLAVGGHSVEFNDVIKVFQVADGGLAWTLEQYSRSGASSAPVAFSPDGSLLAAGATDGIFIWALPDFTLMHTLPIEETGATDWVTDLAFSPDSRFLLAGYWDNYALLWQVQE